MKHLIVALLLLACGRAIAATSVQQNLGFTLDPALQKRILSPKNIEGIMQIRSVESFVRNAREFSGREGGFVIVGIDLSLKGDFEFEGAWHGRLCFVRKYGDSSWDHAVEIHLPRSFEFAQFRSMTDDEIGAFIARNRAPNQPLEPTSPSGRRGSP